MNIETPESRQLFSVAAAFGAGTLFVYGDDGGNALNVKKAGPDISVEKYSGGKYSEFYRISASKVKTIKIYGRGGSDSILVDDFIKASVYINGGDGADYLKAGGILCYVYGQDQNATDTNDDGAADTLISGGYNKTYLFGQRGNDHFYFDRSSTPSVSGDDYMYGGSGNDTFYASRDKYVGHHISGGSGTDLVDFSNYGIGAIINMNNSEYHAVLFGDSFTDRYQIGSDVENAIGTPFKDSFDAPFTQNINNTLWGMGGDDSIYGGNGNNVLYGGSGNDVISGENGNDRIYGESGKDTLIGYDGSDSIYGGSNNDSIMGLNGSDALYGEGGDDTVVGGNGFDQLYGGSGNDTLNARDYAGGDLVFGGNSDGKKNGSDYAIVDITGGLIHDLVYAVVSELQQA
jgi:Ca2+-binding RTX toxin-like protein